MDSSLANYARETYDRIAGFYDAFTEHHDYELWLGNLLPQLEARGLNGQRLLDVACGTGKSFLPMLNRGWQVTGVDISPEMLARARSKVNGQARLQVADMRALPKLGTFDLVWCLDDAVNYLFDASELAPCFGGFRRNLAPGGLCLFDVNTLGTYRRFFAETDVVERHGHRLVWLGLASRDAAPRCASVANVEVHTPDGEVVAQASHRQRHFEPDEIAAALSRAGLECVAIFGHGTDAILEQPLDEAQHTKAVFIAKRSERR